MRNGMPKHSEQSMTFMQGGMYRRRHVARITNKQEYWEHDEMIMAIAAYYDRAATHGT